MDEIRGYYWVFHRQTNAQIEGVNQSLDNLLRCFVVDKPANWDLILAQEEFAYKTTVSRSTKKTPFGIVNGLNPKGTTKFRDLNMEMKRSTKAEEIVDFMKTLHE